MATNMCALDLFLPRDPEHFYLPGGISHPEVISRKKHKRAGLQLPLVLLHHAHLLTTLIFLVPAWVMR